jgi:hypothetical protein
MILGSTPATAPPTIRTLGVKLCFLIPSSEANNRAAAPSFKPEAFPAVTEPSLANAGRNFPNPSKLVSERINSS